MSVDYEQLCVAGLYLGCMCVRVHVRVRVRRGTEAAQGQLWEDMCFRQLTVGLWEDGWSSYHGYWPLAGYFWPRTEPMRD